MLDKTVMHLKQGTFLSTVKSEAKNRIFIYQRNLYNISKYGWSAPRFGERIWVYPHNCKMGLPINFFKNITGGFNDIRDSSGMVIDSLWPIEWTYNIIDHPKIKFCVDHWVRGISWEETGVYEFMIKEIEMRNGPANSCANINAIIERYNNLDLIYNQIKKEGRFRTLKEVDFEKYRSGIEGIMHIGPDGETFFGGVSYHRFAIAYILKIPFPAWVGLVHVSAIPYLVSYREGNTSQRTNI